MGYNEKVILKTIIYHDIFSFALTREELKRFLLTNITITDEALDKSLTKLSNIVVKRDGLYCIKGREKIIDIRKSGGLESKRKLQIAVRAASIISFIPTIKFIGISGGLAMGNVGIKDDIDFFIIVKKDSLFLTRFQVLIALEFLKLRRKRNDKIASDKICCNLFVDESELTWDIRKRDVYIAHEILQVLPLFDRNQTFRKFLLSNAWVKDFVYNGMEESVSRHGYKWSRSSPILSIIQSILLTMGTESLLRFLQIRYMLRHKTRETVSSRILALHPIDYRVKVLHRLSMRMQELGLLTNF